jgi:Na+:H+ antiporter
MAQPDYVVFGLVAGIIILGFGGELFFKRTGIPAFLFLILVGIVLGPVLGVFPGQQLVPVLGIFATLTLIMVIFYGGMDTRIGTVLSGGGRIFVQVVLYVVPSTLAIGVMTSYLFHWDLLLALVFGSMIGGETTAAVVVPLSRGLKFRDDTTTFVTLESVLNSIFSVVLFTAFVGAYQTGVANPAVSLTTIASGFSVGIVIGVALSLAWVVLLNRLKDQGYTYVLTIGLVFATYAISSALGGSGILSALVFGLVLGSYKMLNQVFEITPLAMDPLQRQLTAFQRELSFLLETFFFVFLGLIFSLRASEVVDNLATGLLLLAVLLAFRALATTISTYRSELVEDRGKIVLFCAQGLTPATLAIIAVNEGLPMAGQFLSLVTYVIILTNIVTTAGSIWIRRGGAPRATQQLRVGRQRD